MALVGRLRCNQQFSPALPAAHVERPVVVAVRQAGLDQEVPLVAGLAHPAEVAVADTLGAGPVLGTGAVQAVSCTEEQTSVNNHSELISNQLIRAETNLRLLVII